MTDLTLCCCYRIEAAFESEIALLLQAISQQEEELAHLKQLKKEQVAISIELDDMEANMAHEENALELEARAMSHTQNQLTKTLQTAELEIEKLAAIDLSLFSLVIDKRGLRYPLINEFRLAFCPKRRFGLGRDSDSLVSSGAASVVDVTTCEGVASHSSDLLRQAYS